MIDGRTRGEGSQVVDALLVGEVLQAPVVGVYLATPAAGALAPRAAGAGGAGPEAARGPRRRSRVGGHSTGPSHLPPRLRSGSLDLLPSPDSLRSYRTPHARPCAARWSR